jgi:hypothetical protein
MNGMDHPNVDDSTMRFYTQDVATTEYFGIAFAIMSDHVS